MTACLAQNKIALLKRFKNEASKGTESLTKIPRRVEFSDTELPKSGSGKILKRILRERSWAHQERAVD